MILCPCGRKIESTNANPYQTTMYDEFGNIIHAICVHGHVVINNIKEENEKEDKDTV